MSLLDDDKSLDNREIDRDRNSRIEIEDNDLLKSILLELKKLNKYMELITEERLN